jgi:hypothetical protein
LLTTLNFKKEKPAYSSSAGENEHPGFWPRRSKSQRCGGKEELTRRQCAGQTELSKL